MKRAQPLAGISSQWCHDDAAFRFPRTSGIGRHEFAERPRFPWRPMVVVFALLALGLFLTRGIESDEVISFRLHQVQR